MQLLKLNEDFIAGQPKVESLREAFGRALLTLAKRDQRIVALSADLAQSVGLGDFAEEMGHRYIEVGVAEQNMVTVASGLANMGKIPFAASYAAFSPGRNWEQIRTTICLNNQPVKIAGTHAGLNVGPDGATHQMLEDIALMQVLPNMVVLSPGDVNEVTQMVKLMIDDPRPNYLRLPRTSLPTFTAAENILKIGKAYLVRQDDNPKLTIISTGSMTANALLASGQLFKKGIPSEVIHVPTIKPLDKETILNSVGRTSVTITIEEHQVIAGLGSTIASLILESDIRPTKFKRIGVLDRFGESGSLADLWQEHCLDVDGLINQILPLLDS